MPSEIREMQEDEQEIRKGYKNYQKWIFLPVGAVIVAHFADTKQVIVFGFAAIVMMLSVVEARLYDLCVRLRRTNILLDILQNQNKSN